jgi:hypothetical protein
MLQEVPGGGLGQYGLLLQDPTFTSIKQHASDMLACVRLCIAVLVLHMCTMCSMCSCRN